MLEATFNNYVMGFIRERAKALLAAAVMRMLRFRRPAARNHGARIVVYHDVPAVSAQQFRHQLQYFSEKYEVVSLSQLANAINHGRSVDGWLAITFDDGLKNNVEIAAPLLKKFGFTACFFVTTGFVSLNLCDQDQYIKFVREGLQRRDLPQPMNWEDIRFLVCQGFSIGSHARSHRDLASLPHEQAVEEIVGSQADIEENLGITPAHFAWPFGRMYHFNEELRQVVCEGGYTTCSSAERGKNYHTTSPYNLSRDHLEPHWSNNMVRFFLEGGYDWVKGFRHLFADSYNGE
jgi:peptidoglycan/xylan/chitin deacetylase (PgdA/CDA1 family)